MGKCFRIAIFSLLFGSIGAAAGMSSGEMPNCPPPEDARNFAAILRWMEAIDSVHQPPAVWHEEGDVALKSGAVIGKSCFSGLKPEVAAIVQAKIETALNLALEQSYRCNRILGLGVTKDVFSILRRTRFACANLGSLRAANPPEWNAKIAPLVGPKEVFGQHHHIILNVDSLTNPFAEAIQEAAVPGQLAAVLFHEAQHSTPSLNASWHDTWTALKKSNSSCENNQLEDRILFTTAACFPSSDDGYSLSYRFCTNVCKRAFTWVDNLTDINPNLVSKPLTDTQANQQCELIKKRFAPIEDGVKLFDSFMKAADTLESSKILPQDSSAPTKELRERMSRLKSATGAGHVRVSAIPRMLSSIESEVSELEKFVARTCALKNALRNWSELCSRPHGSLISDLKLKIESAHDFIRKVEKDLKDGGVDHPEMIWDFYLAPGHNTPFTGMDEDCDPSRLSFNRSWCL